MSTIIFKMWQHVHSRYSLTANAQLLVLAGLIIATSSIQPIYYFDLLSTTLKHFPITLQTSESVERLGQQLEETVSALTTARDEARIKTDQLRRAQLDMEQLNDALGYEKDLNTSLHDQV